MEIKQLNLIVKFKVDEISHVDNGKIYFKNSEKIINTVNFMLSFHYKPAITPIEDDGRNKQNIQDKFIELLATMNHDHDDHGTAAVGVLAAKPTNFGMLGMVYGVDKAVWDGYLFNGGHFNSYTDSFAGTFSAGPTVTAASNLLNIIY